MKYKKDGGANWGYKEYKKYRKLKKDCCEVCGREDKKLMIHHKDKNTRNPNPENLMTVCQSCHMGYCHKDESQKYRKVYGISAKQIAEQLNITIGYVYNMKHHGKLEKLLKYKKIA